MRSFTDLCGLRVSVETYVVQRFHCITGAASVSATRSEKVDKRPGASRVGVLAILVGAPPHGRRPSAASAGQTRGELRLY
jgi:hypothetical protein